MDFLKTLNGCFNSSVPSFRKVVLNDSFNDYYKTLLELEQKEREIVKLDEQIFGSVYPLKVGFLALNTYHTKNYGEFVIYPSQETIVINEYLRPLYGNGCINREEQIKTHEYSTIKTCFSNV